MFSFAMLGAQTKTQLEINHLCVALNGKQVTYIAESTLELDKGNKHEIKLYKHDGLTYGITLEIRNRGKKARLIKRSFVDTANGKRKFSRRSVLTSIADHSEITVFTGRASSHITYDQVLQKRIFASYTYNLFY